MWKFDCCVGLNFLLAASRLEGNLDKMASYRGGDLNVTGNSFRDHATISYGDVHNYAGLCGGISLQPGHLCESLENP